MAALALLIVLSAAFMRPSTAATIASRSAATSDGRLPAKSVSRCTSAR